MSERMSQAEIDALIASMLTGSEPAAESTGAPASSAPAEPAFEQPAAELAEIDLGPITQAEVEAAVAAAQAARLPAHPYEGALPEPAAAAPMQDPFPVSAPAPALAAAPAPSPAPAGAQAILMEISLTLTVELGRTRMPLKQVLTLAPGAIITLDSLAMDPVAVAINTTPIMKGEVVVIGERYGVRLTEARLEARKAS